MRRIGGLLLFGWLILVGWAVVAFGVVGGETASSADAGAAGSNEATQSAVTELEPAREDGPPEALAITEGEGEPRPEAAGTLTPRVEGLLAATYDELTVVELEAFRGFEVALELPEGATTSPGVPGAEIVLEGADPRETEIAVRHNCGAPCGVRDWEAFINEDGRVLPRTRHLVGTQSDGAIPGGWIVTGWANDGQHYVVHVVKFDDNEEFFFECEASITGQDVSYIEPVIQLCLSAQPLWFSR